MKNFQRLYHSLLVSISMIVLFASCESMDSNYISYLDKEPYAAKVTNLSILNELNKCTLSWDIPEKGNIKDIIIKYDEEELQFEVTNQYVIDGLQIKGYTFEVYTINKHGQHSIPVTIYGFPSSEQE